MASRIFAHSLPGEPHDRWESLAEHQTAVAALAGEFADIFGFGALARLAGELHDIGKLSPEFQAYICGERTSGGDHSSAGAWIAGKIFAAIIAAHHAGLVDGRNLIERLKPIGKQLPPGWQEWIGPLPSAAALNPSIRPDFSQGPKGFSQSFLTRMLFSCLVDADFLATEAFYAAAEGLPVERGGYSSMIALRDRLREHMDNMRADAAKEINLVRTRILDHTITKADLSPGLFTLTVPTGGGKTLASLSFALEHAVRHNLRRVIYVIPYTSIIEQTADVFRGALRSPDDILEHHASFDWERAKQTRNPDDDSPAAIDKLRRAAENWDVPIVVTTAVQFFESLFANRTSRCRKLHNIAGSAVVFDEAQTLPLPLLKPCVAAIDELARNYRTSIVLCTATQPALRVKDGFTDGFAIDEDRELAPDPQELYRRLKRVAVERLTAPTTDESIAARFVEQPQMLCIVNKREHAQKLYEMIRSQPGATHLSTLMCPSHRRIVLAELRGKLKAGEPVRLVATSLIEAGVDIDFPEVWRAAAGLDSIAQAAGRCNRSGALKDHDGRPRLGRVIVFEPAEEKTQHEIKVRWQASQGALKRFDDPLDIDAVRDYFSELYWRKGDAQLDSADISGRQGVGVLTAIRECVADGDYPFRSIAEAFQLIDEEAMEAVIVPWRADEADDEADRLLQSIAAQAKPSGRDLRRLQQYAVPIPKTARDEWLRRNVLTPVHPALGDAMLKFADLSLYDAETGVTVANPTTRDAGSNIIG